MRAVGSINQATGYAEIGEHLRSDVSQLAGTERRNNPVPGRNDVYSADVAKKHSESASTHPH